MSHRSPKKVAEQCSQDKFLDPVEAAGGGQLMDGRGRISQLPSNLCLGNKLLLSLVSAPALQAPLPCRVLPAPHPCSASLEMLPQEVGKERTGEEQEDRSVPSPAAQEERAAFSLQGRSCCGPAAGLRASVFFSVK